MRLRRAILLGLVGSVFMFSASAARPAASGMVVVGAEKAVELRRKILRSAIIPVRLCRNQR